MTPKPFWPAALALALPLAAPAARADEANQPSLPKCLAHAKALCFWHHPVCVAAEAASYFFRPQVEYTAEMPPPNCPPTLGYAPCGPYPPCGAPARDGVTPACACVPCGSPMPYWYAQTCLPPPAPVCATAPCCPPMPYSVAAGFPATTPPMPCPCPPMPVLAEPMPLGPACCPMPVGGSKEYVVEANLMRRGGPDGRVEETHRTLRAPAGAEVLTLVPGPSGNQPPVSVQFHLLGGDGQKAGVELSVECCSAEKCGKGGERMQCDCACVRRAVQLGKPTHFALHKGKGGVEEMWAEVTVREVPHATPAPTGDPVASAVAGLAAAFQELCGTPTAGMTLPSGHYLQHPPQYFPPSPAFPAPPAPPCVGMVMPAAPMPPPGPGTVIRFVSEDGKSRLEVHHPGAPCMACQALVLWPTPGEALKLRAGKGHVVVSGPDLKASADCVRCAGGYLVFEGCVRLTSREMRLKAADKVEVRLDGRHVEVKPVSATAE